MNTIERFESIYVHDSGIMHVNLDVQTSICHILLDRAGILKNPPKMFDYEIYYRPAVLEFKDVKMIRYPEGYCLNDSIMYQKAMLSEFSDYYCFSLTMTGGWDNDTFMRTVEIIAKDFSITGTAANPQET